VYKQEALATSANEKEYFMIYREIKTFAGNSFHLIKALKSVKGNGIRLLRTILQQKHLNV